MAVKTVQTELPEKLYGQIKALIDEGWFSSLAKPDFREKLSWICYFRLTLSELQLITKSASLAV